MAVSIPIIHRDIKSSNILLDDKMTSKISDFGASRYIPIDKTGLTTRIQGTRVELLTRKKPFSYLSTEGDGLVSHFLDQHAEGNLVQTIDPLIEEGGEEVQEVAALAASCINFRGEVRPTMRQVEHTLEGLWGSKKYKREDTVAELEDDSIMTYCPSSTEGGQNVKESSRRYSLEQEMMMSASYPR
ncbi:hypothetical protein BDA96_03G061400 [Sorghum bicolor]|uniref:Protein kinase domain-containing protein n=1 Tax=Sorghum bicolor TaxID=4558 RepID=A0A921UNY1_SORBI|nr:hypothetical protein BDA96_03G061400 [Sorghum bicolor]